MNEEDQAIVDGYRSLLGPQEKICRFQWAIFYVFLAFGAIVVLLATASWHESMKALQAGGVPVGLYAMCCSLAMCTGTWLFISSTSAQIALWKAKIRYFESLEKMSKTASEKKAERKSAWKAIEAVGQKSGRPQDILKFMTGFLHK